MRGSEEEKEARRRSAIQAPVGDEPPEGPAEVASRNQSSNSALSWITFAVEFGFNKADVDEHLALPSSQWAVSSHDTELHLLVRPQAADVPATFQAKKHDY